jgi:hypothetical protein
VNVLALLMLLLTAGAAVPTMHTDEQFHSRR